MDSSCEFASEISTYSVHLTPVSFGKQRTLHHGTGEVHAMVRFVRFFCIKARCRWVMEEGCGLRRQVHSFLLFLAPQNESEHLCLIIDEKRAGWEQMCRRLDQLQPKPYGNFEE